MVPQEIARPQTLSPPGDQPKHKLERTKSILKQSSKERGEELHSPKREQITFAPEHNLEKHLAEKQLEKKLSVEEKVPPPKTEKRVSLETDKINGTHERKLVSPPPKKDSSESSSSESEDDKVNDLKPAADQLRRISLSSSNSRINFEPIEALNAQKPKPIDKIKKTLLDSESSSSTQDSPRKITEDKKASLKPPEQRVQCSPAVDLATNPSVTFVQEQR